MASPRSVDLAERVVAWHNRHPLARRITRAQVLSIGLVSFPFRAPPGSAAAARAAREAVEPHHSAGDVREEASAGTLRERARARAAGPIGTAGAARAPAAEPPSASPSKQTSRRGWRCAFAENLLAPSSLDSLARWLLREASEARPGPADAPVRELEADTGGPRGAPAARLWCWTAAVELGGVRVRLLASPFAPHAVFGRRLLHMGRIGALGLALLLAGGGAWWQLRPDARSPAPEPTVAHAAVAPTAPSPAPAAASLAVHAPTPAAAVQPQPIAAAAQPAPRPPVAAPTSFAKPQLPPPIDEATRRAARQAAELARADMAERRRAHASASARALGSASAAAPAAHAPPGPQAPPTPPQPARLSAATPASSAPAPRAAAHPAAPASPTGAWAVATRMLRTRFEGEQMLVALRDAAQRTGQAAQLKLEVISAGDDWRAVGWPFATEAEAQRLRAALAERGLQAQVVTF